MILWLTQSVHAKKLEGGLLDFLNRLYKLDESTHLLSVVGGVDAVKGIGSRNFELRLNILEKIAKELALPSLSPDQTLLLKSAFSCTYWQN